jgi:class 3 adenylate cyclase
VTCSSCGQRAAADFAFCPYCGAALAESPAPLEERRVVTVVLADLVGFTARSEAMDPEDVRALLERYHGRLRSELERHGGTVEKFIGDAVMALFGAPVAHEDDPERAVRAALAIRDWATGQDGEPALRIGVHTGEALVDLGARPSHGEAMAAGDVVNTAARLQAAAPPNGVVVGERTRRLTRDVIEYRELEPVQAKGKAAPVGAWEAVAVVGEARPLRVAAPLVGRDRELEILEGALARAAEQRTPFLVTLLGEPGIGKSRLALELRGTTTQVQWRWGRSLPYGEGVTYWAFGEIVKAQAGILESDAAADAAAKLHAAVAEVAADPADAVWLERRLGPLIGVAPAPGEQAEEGPMAWARFVEVLAERRPLALVFEDLHWADDALLDFIGGLAERTRGVPLLVVVTARPELLERRPAWGAGTPNALTMALAPLSDPDVERLLEVLCAERPDAARLQTLLERTGGNPLFAEQYARIAAESQDLEALPGSVQGIVAARLDALPADERRLVQDAAVVGDVFWSGAVGAVSGREPARLLQALERKGHVRRRRRSSVQGEDEYAFTHVVIREGAYHQIPRAARAEKHRRAAAWIAALGRAEDHAELIAHHHLRALELAEAAGVATDGLGPAAREALTVAGDRAATLYAADAAARFYEAALRLATPGTVEHARLLLKRATPDRVYGGGDLDRLAQARDALLAVGETAPAAEAELAISDHHRAAGRQGDSDEHLRRAWALVADEPATRAAARILCQRAYRAAVFSEQQAALDLARRALTMVDEHGWRDLRADALRVLGMTRLDAGDAGGWADLETALALRREAGALAPLANVINMLAVHHQIDGDLEAAYALRREAADLAERIGLQPERRWYGGVLAEQLYRRGDWDEALQRIERWLAGERHYLTPQLHVLRAEIRLLRGDAAGAVADVTSARRTTPDDRQLGAYVRFAAAHVFATAGQHAVAAQIADAVVPMLRDGESLHVGIVNLPLFAQAMRRLGRSQELLEALPGTRPGRWRDACTAYAAGDFAHAADLLAAAGERVAEAEARLQAGQAQRAAAFYASVGARV